MDLYSSTRPATSRAKDSGGAVLVIVPLALLAAWWLLGWFDDKTELLPTHDGAIVACFGLACLAAGACFYYAVTLYRDMAEVSRPPRGVGVLAAAVVGFISMMMLTSRVAGLIEEAIDFPPDQTHTFQVIQPISRAYHSHGKSQSWTIQTMGAFYNLDITEEDYDWMSAHRKPGDGGANPDDIPSDGHFCARITLQRAGQAVRILHAGSQKLPQGTMMVCPAAAAGQTLPAAT